MPVSYGIAEGMRSGDCNGGNPGVWKSTDGRIWFPTVRGVAAIDPTAGNRLPPPVVLEEAWANKLTLALDGQTSVPPGNNTFDFRFTALSFSAPEKLRFRYRLEPSDKDWVDAGTRRTAHYTNMAPGKYSFQVAAANAYGIWNEHGASVRFVLQPHFYQTNWFYALCAAIFLALLWMAYQFRVHQLQRESKQLRDVIDTIPGYVWSALPDGFLDFISRRWLEFSGLSLEEGLGWGWEAAVHPDDVGRFGDEWRAAVASGKAMESEARVRRADGQYRWLLIRSVPLHDKRGKVVKWYGTSTDIDDRKQAEDALRRSQAYLTEAQSLSHTGSFGWKPSTGEVQWSEETYRIFQYDPTTKPTVELVIERVHPEDRALTQQIIERASQEEKDYEHEYRLLMPDGSVKYLHIMAHALRDESGSLEFVGAAMDVTAARQAEEALRAQAALLDLTHDTVFVMDMEGVIKYWNRGAEERYGWTAEHALGRVVHDLLKTVFPGPLEEIRAEASRTGRWEGEILHTKKDGTQVVVASRWALQRDERGAPMAILETNNDITLRKRAEESLRLSNAYNRSLIEASPDPLVTIGPDGKITDVNAATEAATGRSRGELVGTDFCDYFTEPSKARAGYEQVFREGMVRDYPLELRHRDGGVMSVLYNASVYRDESGRVTGVFAAARDITERQRAEEALRKSETRFRTVVDNAADALFIYDFEERTIVDVNRQACESLGYTRQELIGTTPLAFDRNVDRAATESIAERTAAGETVIDTHWHQRKDGTLFPVEAHTSQYWYGGRRFLLKVARDITDRKRAEQALQESEACLAEGQRLSHTGSFAWTPATRQSIYWSKEMFRIFGLNPQEGVPSEETFWQRIHPEDLDRTRALLLNAAGGNMEYEHDHRIVLPDGTVKHIHAIGHPVLDEKGQVAKYVGTTVDVTDRKRAEEERARLRQLEADLAHISRVSMMGELAASIAHEVNQPLSGVVVNANACLRWLAGDAPNLEEAREAVRRIVRDGKRAGDVIARVRALATKTATAKERLDMNETIWEVIALAGDELRKNRVAVQTEFAPDLSPVSGDRVQLQQVVLNLVMNGIEAMSSVEERPRELMVRTQNDEGDQVRVTVQDSGVGLDPQGLGRIFEAFYTTKQRGMGMGLSISRSIIQNHGGKLWAVANKGPGVSVQFTIPKYE